MSRILVAALFVSAAAAASQSVEVNNTTANPVPVTVTNPVQVSGSVQVTNTPAVTISGTPTVTVANQPGTGTLYSEPFTFSTGATGGGTAGPVGSTVPPGKRRTIHTVSATWTCASGKSALVSLDVNVAPGSPPTGGSVFGGLGFVYLPGQFAYSFPAASQDTFASSLSLNLIVPPNGFVQPIAASDFGANCFISIWVFGEETDAP